MKMRSGFRYAVAATLVMALPGCSEDPEELAKSPGIATLRAALKTGVPLAYAAAVATRAVSGASLSGVVASQTCSSYPCAALVTIATKAGAFPVKFEKYGDIVVAGLWTSGSSAVLAVTFVNMEAGVDTFRVARVGAFPVTIGGSGVKVVYANVDVNITDDPAQMTSDELQTELDRLTTPPPSSPDVGVDVSMDAWIIDSDNMGTPGDFADDQYRISGASQYAGVDTESASVMQLVMIETAISNGCVANPRSGYAVINQVGASSSDPVILGAATLRFHSGCDGKAAVDAAFGDYFKSIGKTVALGLE
jgi:hypothetical protein